MTPQRGRGRALADQSTLRWCDSTLRHVSVTRTWSREEADTRSSHDDLRCSLLDWHDDMRSSEDTREHARPPSLYAGWTFLICPCKWKENGDTLIVPNTEWGNSYSSQNFGSTHLFISRVPSLRRNETRRCTPPHILRFPRLIPWAIISNRFPHLSRTIFCQSSTFFFPWIQFLFFHSNSWSESSRTKTWHSCLVSPFIDFIKKLKVYK